MTTADALETIPNAAGVYLFRHRVTGDAYVGSSLIMRTRIIQHLSGLRRGTNGCRRLQELASAHGLDFDISVLELTRDCRAAEGRHVASLCPTLNHNRPSANAPEPTKDGRVQLSARVAPELFTEFQAIARLEDRTLSYMVEKAVREFVEAHRGKASRPAKR